MADNFINIVFTWPTQIDGEATIIEQLLDNGTDYVHLRRPDASEADMRRLIESISSRYRNKLKLHSHFHLVSEYGLAGVHLNSRNPNPPIFSTLLSCSFHNLNEISNALQYQYVTLSPIYPSISKPGYTSNLSPAFLKGKITAPNVIALGGITIDKFPELKAAGFAGAARLGDVWQKYLD